MPLPQSHYITISDLQRVRLMITIFHDLQSVPDDEKLTVGRILSKWTDKLYSALPELTEDPENPQKQKPINTSEPTSTSGLVQPICSVSYWRAPCVCGFLAKSAEEWQRHGILYQGCGNGTAPFQHQRGKRNDQAVPTPARHTANTQPIESK